MLHNRLVILSGLPGSGKSTYCEKMKDFYGSKGVDVKVISSDEIRREMCGRPNDLSADKQMWKEFNARAINYSVYDNTIVILDATFLTNRKRYDYALKFKKYYKQIFLVVMDTPLERCLEQNKMREPDKVVPEKVILGMREIFEPIERYLCFSYFYSVEYMKPDGKIRYERL